MKTLKIALLQIAPCKTLKENLEKGMEACKTAKEMGADLALFPEMWSNGYHIYDRPVSEWMAEAISTDSEFVQAFSTLARSLHMAVGITLLEKQENAPRNSLILFDRFGERKFIYAKVHTCAFDVERNLTPGDDFYVTTLDTACGEVNVGAMICYDREFPESARILMLKGAELILVPNACPMEINRLSQLRARAFENMTAIATCNYPGSVPDCNGSSSVFDGVAYVPELDHSRDTCILQADEKEGIYIAQLDLEQLRRYRETEVHGNSYRHPQKYRLLAEEKPAMNTNNFYWIREPKTYSIENGRIQITTEPHTDLWQRTYYHFRNDNAPVFQMETKEKFFSFIVKTDFRGSKHRFDQCGVVMYLDSENWIKGSVEFENEEFQHLGSVVTNHGYSDWATTEIPADVKIMWYRFSRRQDDYCIECSRDGVHYSQMRICHMWEGADEIRFGIYACSPEASSFTAVFTDMQVKECAWKAHEGQLPDEEDAELS